jgi:hypothetical protein
MSDLELNSDSTGVSALGASVLQAAC